MKIHSRGLAPSPMNLTLMVISNCAVAGTLTMAQLMQLLAVRPSANLAAISGRMPAPNIPQQVASFDQETDLRMQASPGTHANPLANVSC